LKPNESTFTVKETTPIASTNSGKEEDASIIERETAAATARTRM